MIPFVIETPKKKTSKKKMKRDYFWVVGLPLIDLCFLLVPSLYFLNFM